MITSLCFLGVLASKASPSGKKELTKARELVMSRSQYMKNKYREIKLQQKVLCKRCKALLQKGETAKVYVKIYGQYIDNMILCRFGQSRVQGSGCEVARVAVRGFPC